MSSPALPRRKAAIAFILVTAVLDVVAMGIVMPVLPGLIEEFAGSGARAGFLNGVFVAIWAAMQFIASPVVGSLSDQYGRRPVLLMSAAGLSADYVLMAMAPNLWWLAVGRIIAGVTTASFTTVYAYMADITPPEGRARAYGLIGAAFSGGFVLGPLIGGLLGEIGPRAPFWFAAALSGVTFFYGLFVLPESLPRETRMKFSWARANPFGAFALLRSHHELFGLSAVNFLLYFAHYAIPAVFVLYAGARFGWSTAEVGAVLAFWGLLDMLIQSFLVGPAVKRFGDRPMMIVGLAAGAIGFTAMGLAPVGWLFTLAMVPNAFMGLAMPTIMALMTQHVSESEQGQLQGANMSVGSIAGVVSPLFFGAVYAMSIAKPPTLPHPGSSFLIAGAIMLASMLLGWVVARRAQRDEALQAP